MDILIKGMEMPKQMESPIKITIFKNGSVWINDVTFGKGKLPNAKAVALPEHGDLIDRNELPIIGITDYKLESHTVVEFEDVLNAPVIVEASE